jgi:hypothetical protein
MEERAATAPAGQGGAAATADPVTPLAVMEALARLVAAASVYPREHPRISAIVQPVLEAVRGGMGGRGRLLFRLSETDPARKATAPAQRLLRDLAALGVQRIQIDGAVSVQDLFEFAKFIRSQASAGEGFRHADFALLPWTILVEERSFGQPTFRDDAELPRLDETSEAEELRTFRGGREDVDPATMVLVRRAVRAALRGQRAAFAAAVAAGRAPASEQESTRASAEAVRAWLERHDPAKVQTRTPAEILADAERELPQMMPGIAWAPVLEGIRRVIDEFMRDAFRGEMRADFDVKTAVPTETAQRAGSKADLALRISDFTFGAEPFGSVSAMDRAEHLSILLHLLHKTTTRGETEGIVRRLGACLSGRTGPRERPVLVGWLRETASGAAAADMDGRLVPVFGALRMSGGGAVADVLLETCSGEFAHLAAAFWPHLAYEMITADDPAAGERRAPLAALVGRTPPERMRAEAGRLVTLVNLRPRPAAAGAFSPPVAGFHPIYEVLLDAPRETGLAAAVTSAFMQDPPKHPAAGALTVLAPGEERAQRLVARLIRDGDTRSAALRALAVEILVGTLRSAPKRRRGDAWVAPALLALGELACVESVTMLREVRASRLLWIWWRWPKSARRAAAVAMGMGAADLAETAAGAAEEGAP